MSNNDMEDDLKQIYSKGLERIDGGPQKNVWKGIDRQRGLEVAWHEIKLTDEATAAIWKKEVALLNHLKHDNLIEFYGFWTEQTKIIYITELVTSGPLSSFVRLAGGVTLSVIKGWCRQILCGLKYLHEQKPRIIHRNIKLDNIFYHGDKGKIKIGDLGLATSLDSPKSFRGTPEFMAPEFYQEKYNEKVDIWAFGMCVIEMVTLESPYKECAQNINLIYKSVTQGLKPHLLMKIKDPNIVDFVCCCLEVDVEKRFSTQELLNHPFLVEKTEDDDALVDLRPPPEYHHLLSKHAATKEGWESYLKQLFPSGRTTKPLLATPPAPAHHMHRPHVRAFMHLHESDSDDEDVLLSPEKPSVKPPQEPSPSSPSGITPFGLTRSCSLGVLRNNHTPPQDDQLPPTFIRTVNIPTTTTITTTTIPSSSERAKMKLSSHLSMMSLNPPGVAKRSTVFHSFDPAASQSGSQLNKVKITDPAGIPRQPSPHSRSQPPSQAHSPSQPSPLSPEGVQSIAEYQVQGDAQSLAQHPFQAQTLPYTMPNAQPHMPPPRSRPPHPVQPSRVPPHTQPVSQLPPPPQQTPNPPVVLSATKLRSQSQPHITTSYTATQPTQLQHPPPSQTEMVVQKEDPQSFPATLPPTPSQNQKNKASPHSPSQLAIPLQTQNPNIKEEKMNNPTKRSSNDSPSPTSAKRLKNAHHSSNMLSVSEYNSLKKRMDYRHKIELKKLKKEKKECLKRYQEERTKLKQAYLGSESPPSPLPRSILASFSIMESPSGSEPPSPDYSPTSSNNSSPFKTSHVPHANYCDTNVKLSWN